MSLQPILDYFASIECVQPEIDLLQPADPFLDTTGEDLRRRIFMTQDNAGASLCLRPEFTVPVCLLHLKGGNGQARYAYGGNVFRQRKDDPSEFLQAGFEDLGRKETEIADAECIGVAADLLKSLKQKKTSLVVGHQAAFVAVLRALDLPAALQKKLLRAFGDEVLLLDVIAQLSAKSENQGTALPTQIMQALEAADEAKLISELTDLMVADGLPLTGSRTPQAIAVRLQEKHALGTARLTTDQRQVLETFLKMDVSLKDAEKTLKAFEKDTGLDLDEAIRPISALAASLTAGKISGRYRASFGRRLDYYTGLVFEFYRKGDSKPIIGGGRYDQLLTLLGAEKTIPAVGFAIWVDRLGGLS